MTSYLFVYGTLRLGSPHPLAKRLAHMAEHVGVGTTPGVLYDFGAYPGANLGGRGGVVVGDLFALTGDSPVLPTLDRYEGIAAGEAAPFHRETAIVTLAARQSLEAWVYALTQIPRARRVPSGDWIAHRWMRSARHIVGRAHIR